MAFDSIKTDIEMLFRQMVEQPQDARELAEQIRNMLNEARATGMPLPADLVALEEQIERDFGEKPA
jgi:hypothetical protein